MAFVTHCFSLSKLSSLSDRQFRLFKLGENLMSSGLLALLDDVSALLKATAASLDDVPTQVAKTTSRVAGIVIDDAAVTPKYVVGLDPSRELIIIFHIARSSLLYKLFVLSPIVMILGYLAFLL